jgi:hypothetical protein
VAADVTTPMATMCSSGATPWSPISGLTSAVQNLLFAYAALSAPSGVSGTIRGLSSGAHSMAETVGVGPQALPSCMERGSAKSHGLMRQSQRGVDRPHRTSTGVSQSVKSPLGDSWYPASPSWLVIQ